MPLKEVGAYLLANIAGHEHPTVADVEKILNSVGASVNHESIEKLISELKGKNVHEVIASGRTKLFSTAFAAAPAAGKAASPKKGSAPAKKEEVKEEEEEGEAFSLFD